jgi:hypothetical protein
MRIVQAYNYDVATCINDDDVNSGWGYGVVVLFQIFGSDRRRRRRFWCHEYAIGLILLLDARLGSSKRCVSGFLSFPIRRSRFAAFLRISAFRF